MSDDAVQATAVERDTTTFLTQSGIQERMMCGGSTAARIEDAFVTVEQLLDAAEGNEPLTNVDGIGSATAGVIQEWYENRENRERMASGATVERTSSKSMTIKNNGDWSDALGIEITEGDDE